MFRVVSLGNSVFESPCAADRRVIRRVSVADASLSLSLSLLWASRPNPLRPACRLDGIPRRGRGFCGPSPLRPALAGRPGSPQGGRGSAGVLAPCRGVLRGSPGSGLGLIFRALFACFMVCRVLPHAGCLVVLRLVSWFVRVCSWGLSLSAPRGPPVLWGRVVDGWG